MNKADIVQALQVAQEIDRRNNYGHVLPIAAFDDTVQRGQDKYAELKQALDAYNASQPSNKRYRDAGLDHYAHRYTTYLASQQGPLLGTMMLVAAAAKEIPDFVKYAIKDGVRSSWNESGKDLTEDWRGYKMGMNSSVAPEQNPDFNKYNGGTVRFVLNNLIKEQK